MLPQTEPLNIEGDLASQMVDGADKFLLRKIAEAAQQRDAHWQAKLADDSKRSEATQSLRYEFARRLGVRDSLASDTTPYLLTSADRSAVVGHGKDFEIQRVQWRTFGDCYGRGLLLVPVDQAGKSKKPIGQMIAIPDCENTPEQLVGLLPGIPPASQYGRILAENGFMVLVPILVNRAEQMPKLSHREWLYRSAFEMGRGLVAYEVQELQAVINWMHPREAEAGPVGVFGWGEGGLLALYTAAVDERVRVVGISGYLQSRDRIWNEPIDRNVFGLLEEYGDAELLALIAPRNFVVEAARGPISTFTGGKGAPYRLETPTLDSVQTEFKRAESLIGASSNDKSMHLIVSGDGSGEFASAAALNAVAQQLGATDSLVVSLELPQVSSAYKPDIQQLSALAMTHKIHELNTHSQNLLRESHYLRQTNTLNLLDYSSLGAYEKSSTDLRKHFYENVIGRFDEKVLPFQPRTRRFQETEHWIGYEVVLDVYPEVFAYGLLLIPKDLKKGERRPVVVCQHGLEGRPQDTIGEKGYEAYKAFSAKLAERGFITFAPQNLYIFTDRFRSLQRKANPLKKSLFSIITPQHQQIVDWLQTLEFVDGERIGFYGLSYGGKTAMRVPALVTDYKLSICSADFNEWVDKNASTRNPRSYTFFGEYEIFEFDLGSTFNYAEMAALIAPRPFMVERGHNDGVADDWTVAYEYAKIRNLYAAKLKIPQLTEIEWFDGPHTINGKGSFEFLHRHLEWPIRTPIEPLK